MKYTFSQKNRVGKNDGFTIIETLVAITILMIAIAGPLTVVSKGLTAALYARDQMIASYLAQDAMEWIKNTRDNTKLTGRDVQFGWLNGITNGVDCNINSPCTVSTVNILNQGDPTDMHLFSNNGYYYCTMGNTNTNSGRLYIGPYGYTPSLVDCAYSDQGYKPSPFTRNYYVVTNAANPDEATLVVTVSWKEGTVSNSVVLKSEIFNTYR